MAYKLEHVMADHLGVLVGTMQKWSNSQPDVYIISEEGHKIYTQKVLVSFYSSTLSNIFTSSSDNDIPGITIPATSNSIVNLLKVLATGIAITKNKAELVEVSNTAEAMGITMGNWQIGVKNGKVSQPQPEPIRLNAKLKKSKGKKNPNVSLKEEPVDDSDHSREKTKKHFCVDCGKGFGRKDHLNRHASTHGNKNYECDSCSSMFANKESLAVHMTKVHDIDLVDSDQEMSTQVKMEREILDTSETSFPATGESGRENRESLDDNFDDKADGDVQDESSPVGDGINPGNEDMNNACSQCDKTFKNKYRLSRHEVSHSGIKLSCEVCTSTFSRKDKLSAHMRKKHSQTAYNDSKEADHNEIDNLDVEDLPNFECPYCQEVVDDLAEHCLKKHGDGEADGALEAQEVDGDQVVEEAMEASNLN